MIMAVSGAKQFSKTNMKEKHDIIDSICNLWEILRWYDYCTVHVYQALREIWCAGL